MGPDGRTKKLIFIDYSSEGTKMESTGCKNIRKGVNGGETGVEPK
jgi:hypothetical protein